MVSTLRTITESSDKQFKTYFKFNSDSFSTFILKNNNAWTADLTWNDITKLADQLNIQAEDYYSTLKKYVDDTPSKFEIEFNNKELICYCKENKFKLKYFSCQVKEIKFTDCIYDLIDIFSTQNEELKQQNAVLLKEAGTLREGNKILEQEFSQLVDRKRKEDQELLSSFVLVLNEKKRRIQHLTQTLQAFKAGRPVLNPKIEVKKNLKRTVKQEKTEVSESDTSNSDKDYNTDEEINKEEIEPIDKALPSKSFAHINNDLFLSDTEDTVDLPKRKKVEDDNDILNMPSTSNYNKPEKTMENDLEDDSPKISFNTQDLLDCV